MNARIASQIMATRVEDQCFLQLRKPRDPAPRARGRLSLCSDVKLFVRANLDTAKLSITSTQILKFWFRVFKIKKREFKFGITFLGFRCGELLCSSLFALPLQDPQNMFFSGQFDQKTKFIAKSMLFVFSIRGALVTLQYDNNC